MATRTSKRTKPYQQIVQLPPLSAEQYEGLRSSIAINGVKVPILIDEKKQIIDGWHRKQIAEEFGYECPEIVDPDLTIEDKRTLARALNLARRQLTSEQKRCVIADQLMETPKRSNRWIAKQLGVTHPTVASVRRELESGGIIYQQSEVIGEDGKRYRGTHTIYEPTPKPLKPSNRTKDERKQRLAATTLIHGDCRKKLKDIKTNSVDLVFCDPPYPEIRKRGDDYPRIKEADWFDLMKEVVQECKRVVKPTGSAVFVLQPNYEKLGKMRLWLFDFVSWAGREWNLVQDCWWWTTDAMPLAGTRREYGLMRQSVKCACGSEILIAIEIKMLFYGRQHKRHWLMFHLSDTKVTTRSDLAQVDALFAKQGWHGRIRSGEARHHTTCFRLPLVPLPKADIRQRHHMNLLHGGAGTHSPKMVFC